MPQFDFTTISTVLLCCWLSTLVYYSFFSINLLSEIVVISKFREKLSYGKSNKTFNKVFVPNASRYKSFLN